MNRGSSLLKKRAGAKSIGTMMPKLTRKAFEKYGFPAAALLLDWENIVGAELATYTQPEQLKWPRQKDVEPDDTNPTAGITGFRDLSGATLVVRVDGPRSIELQHSGTQLIERINAYFGYKAIVELRIIQAPITVFADAECENRKARPATQPADLDQSGVSAVESEALRTALAAMANGLEARKSARAA